MNYKMTVEGSKVFIGTTQENLEDLSRRIFNGIGPFHGEGAVIIKDTYGRVKTEKFADFVILDRKRIISLEVIPPNGKEERD